MLTWSVMRSWLSMVLLVALGTGCPEHGKSPMGQRDASVGHDGNSAADAAADSVVPPDACFDTDNDGVCNVSDKCPGHDDMLDSDGDTVANGCDRCPSQDDRPDLNMNGLPDCAEVMSRTIDVKKVGTNYWRGWHANQTATHSSANDNTLAGTTGGTNYNSYFVFSLAGFTASNITEVRLELELEAYVSADASETVSIWDVTTPSTTVETTALDLTVHNDLGTGHRYGMATVTAGSVGSSAPVSWTLDAQAATDLKAKLGGEFVVGVHLDATPGYVRFSAAAEARIARLVFKYTP